jgi:hypothetical protein
MSDFSHRHCRKCRRPEYACACESPDLVAPMIDFILRKEIPPRDHPWLDEENPSDCARASAHVTKCRPLIGKTIQNSRREDSMETE